MLITTHGEKDTGHGIAECGFRIADYKKAQLSFGDLYISAGVTRQSAILIESAIRNPHSAI